MPNNNKNSDADAAEHSDLGVDTSRLRQWNQREDVAGNWNRGVSLTEVWFHCLSDTARRRYRTERDDNRRASIRSEMQFEIADALFDGRLIAIASVDTAAASPVLARLDAYLFRPRVCKIDWQEGYVEALGKRFSDVHIVTKSPQQADPAPGSPSVQPQPEIVRRRGRKSLSPLLEQAARQVARLDPLFRDRIQEKQIGDIQAGAKVLAPGQFTGSATPGRSTVARFVQAQRGSGWPCLSDPANPENPE